MPQYQNYPTKITMPHRKTRKGERNKVFAANRKAAKLLRERRGTRVGELDA